MADVFPKLRVIADPATVNYQAGTMQSPTMSLDGIPFVTVIPAGGGPTAAVQAAGDSIPDATIALVVTNALHVADGAGDFVAPILTIMDGEAGPISGVNSALPTYSLIAGVEPVGISLRAAQVYAADPTDITPTVIPDDLGGLLGVASFGRGFGGVDFHALRTPTVFRTVTATAAGETIVWNPAAGRRFRLMGYSISVCGTLAALGVETIDFLDGTGGAIIASHLAAVAATVSGDSQISVQLGNGIPGVLDNNLVVDLGTAFTAGGVAINVWGTEEP